MLTAAHVQIRSDIIRWVSDTNGTRALLYVDAPRLRALIDSLLADGDVTGTTIWYLLTIDGTDITSINQRLLELVPENPKAQ